MALPAEQWQCLELDSMTDKCEPEKRFDLQFSSLRELFDEKLRGLQAEFTKSERVYPTKEQIDDKISGLVTKEDLAGLNLQVKAMWVLIVILFGAIIGLLSR